MFNSIFRKRRDLPDFSKDAEDLFRGIAKEFCLKIEKRNDDPVELSMDLPKQVGLNYDLWLCLQNSDELWFCVGDLFTCSMFPYSEVKDKFSDNLRATLSGDYRILIFRREQRSKPAISVLQKESDNGWETVFTHSHTIASIFYMKRFLKREVLKLIGDDV
jgi:hypothetical protein